MKAGLPALFALLLAAPAAAAASSDDGGAGPVYRLSVEVDAPILLVGGTIAASYFLMSESAPPACAPLCDSSHVNVLDRWAAGNYSQRWQTIGDVTTASAVTLVPLTLFLAEDLRPGLNDLLVVAEAALLSSSVQVLASYAVGRPRPRVYGQQAPLDERNDANAGRSFFSGHVANCVAVTIATRHTLARLHRPVLAWTVFAAGMAASALVGVARVGGGSHFPTDVAAGFAVGAGVGIAVPALHGSRLAVEPMAAGTDARGVALAGTF